MNPKSHDMYQKSILLTLICLACHFLFLHNIEAQTNLTPGDIAIVGFNFDNPDELAFMAITDLDVGTEIHFTDNGWKADDSFRDTEGTFTWTAPVDIPKGTIVKPSVSSVAFAATGDQIIAYQGNETSPSFIFAINSEGTGWQADATTSNESCLPDGLTDGYSAIALDEVDNAVYNMSVVSGSKNELLGAICNSGNWDGSNSDRQEMPKTPGSGEPTSLEKGDIAIIGFNFDNPDEIAFVILTDIEAGTEIQFTDKGWLSSGGFRSHEGTHVWSTPIGYPAGTVFSVQTGGASFSGSGDQIIAFQGDLSSPNVIFALNSEENGWQADATSSNTSALPAGLVNGENAIALDEIDNAVYNMSVTSGNRNDILTAICNPVNWNGHNSDRQTMPGGSFSVIEITKIHEIQGAGMSSPLAGTTVTIEGIVTGDFQKNGSRDNLKGFFVQEEDDDNDGNDETSEGIFVYDNNFGQVVETGEKVRVSGEVAEYYDMTELTSITEITIMSSGHPLPKTVNAGFPFPDETFPERYEGMLISLPDGLTVISNRSLGKYGQFTIAESRPAQQTQVNQAQGDFAVLTTGSNSGQIIIDDGQINSWPNPVAYPPPALAADNTLRAGATVSGIFGVLHEAFDDYRLHPTQTITFNPSNTRQSEPPNVGGRLTIISMNLNNYFNGNGSGGGFPAPRGADSKTEFDRQTNKIVSAILKTEADIIGLIELENDGHTANPAIEDLVTEINAEAGSNLYKFIITGKIGSDDICNGLIYNPAVVEPAGDFKILDNNEHHGFDDNLHRPSLGQAFRELSTGYILNIVVSHFKSKRCDGCSGLNCDQGDGQSCYNQARVQAAQALIEWLETDPLQPIDKYLCIGDFNAYAGEDPVDVFLNAGYTNLAGVFSGNNAYSYIYSGQTGTLDYAFASPGLINDVTGCAFWHVNADEPPALDYNTENKYPGLYDDSPFRFSDHDPLIAGLNLTPAAEVKEPAPVPLSWWGIVLLIVMIGMVMFIYISYRS